MCAAEPKPIGRAENETRRMTTTQWIITSAAIIVAQRNEQEDK
jgi:hypothetical protein